jgi:hypothetical protein
MLPGLRVKTNSSDNPEIVALFTLFIRFGLDLFHTVIGVEKDISPARDVFIEE